MVAGAYPIETYRPYLAGGYPSKFLPSYNIPQQITPITTGYVQKPYELPYGAIKMGEPMKYPLSYGAIDIGKPLNYPLPYKQPSTLHIPPYKLPRYLPTVKPSTYLPPYKPTYKPSYKPTYLSLIHI